MGFTITNLNKEKEEIKSNVVLFSWIENVESCGFFKFQNS